mmetsp:Transcript_92054/g.269348  ORF Transcript_92054/g.269348 Transcript_92054/m.269348 type:complete len:220 (-) Transcript_92054:278-937(-)
MRRCKAWLGHRGAQSARAVAGTLPGRRGGPSAERAAARRELPVHPSGHPGQRRAISAVGLPRCRTGGHLPASASAAPAVAAPAGRGASPDEQPFSFRPLGDSRLLPRGARSRSAGDGAVPRRVAPRDRPQRRGGHRRGRLVLYAQRGRRRASAEPRAAGARGGKARDWRRAQGRARGGKRQRAERGDHSSAQTVGCPRRSGAVFAVLGRLGCSRRDRPG